jgi:hypothetical protein
MPSRFTELWVTGKIANDRKTREEVGERADREAARIMSELIPEPSQRIFTNLKSRRRTETGAWLKTLIGDVPKVTDEFAHSQANAIDSFEEGRVWIDALFHQFAELALTFNEDAVGTDLSVECERPKFIETRDETIWFRPVTSRTYQGRISTRFWSEVVRCDDKKISVYVFPSEMTIGFKSGQYTDDELPPFLVAEHTGTRENAWTIQGEAAPVSKIGPLAKELFGDLIRVTSGKMAESELFSSHQTAPKLGENVAVGYDKNTQPQSPAQADLHASGADRIDTDDLDVMDACDIVDKVIDKELKRLYAESVKFGPGVPEAAEVRKQISAMQSFRMRIVDAFEQYTHDSHAALPKAAPVLQLRKSA